jgi:hypothetical protein
MVVEAQAGGQCNKRVRREATRGRPGACGGWSRADSVGGGPSVWRHSRSEEDSACSAVFETMARHARWSRGRARAVQQRRGTVVLVAEVGGGRVMMR